MPAAHRRRTDDQAGPPLPRQPPHQRGEQRPIGLAGTAAGTPARRSTATVAQHQPLDLIGDLAPPA
jgi:hypothetical protein